MTHTPGPWAMNFAVARVDAFQNGWLVPICKMLWPTEERTETETEANARLIAAAPQLLEALEKCLPSVCQAVVSPGAMFPKKECGKCGYCLGKAAIAKAKGE